AYALYSGGSYRLQIYIVYKSHGGVKHNFDASVWGALVHNFWTPRPRTQSIYAIYSRVDRFSAQLYSFDPGSAIGGGITIKEGGCRKEEIFVLFVIFKNLLETQIHQSSFSFSPF